MAMTIRVDIVSMEKPIFSGEATFVSIPTEAGEM
ncbi:MAG: F0F1 ATP synthase subunit epsilon, partial [Halothiobacillus sp. 14-56-357]